LVLDDDENDDNDDDGAVLLLLLFACWSYSPVIRLINSVLLSLSNEEEESGYDDGNIVDDLGDKDFVIVPTLTIISCSFTYHSVLNTHQPETYTI